MLTEQYKGVEKLYQNGSLNQEGNYRRNHFCRNQDSLKRALPQEFFDKTTNETIQRIKSSTIPEFKSKGNKIRYKANSNVLEKIDDAINSIKKGHIERFQEKLKEG